MEDLISIIVPIYNKEEYLEACLERIINQSYYNIQIVLINDGSTDQSLEICEKYAYKDKRVEVINQINKGVSNARNNGIKLAKGKYLCFIDADDLLEIDYVKKLYNGIRISNQIDGCLCSYKTINEVGVEEYYSFDMGIHNRDEILINALKRNTSCFALWNKIYKLSIIKKNNIRFNEQVTNGEDMLFACQYLYHCNLINSINDVLYIYIMREGSTCYLRTRKDSFNDNWLTEEKVIIELDNLTKSRTKINQYVAISAIEFCNEMLRLFVYFDINDDRLLKIKKMHKRYMLNYIICMKFKFRKIIKMLIVYYNPTLFFDKISKRKI